MSLSQRDGRDLARRLLRRADADATLVRRVIDDADIADSIIGFHAQQAVEKSIKAVLAARDIEYGKTHQLHFLIRLLEENEIDEPPLDRHATLIFIEGIRRWAGEAVER